MFDICRKNPGPFNVVNGTHLLKIDQSYRIKGNNAFKFEISKLRALPLLIWKRHDFQNWHASIGTFQSASKRENLMIEVQSVNEEAILNPKKEKDLKDLQQYLSMEGQK